MALIIRIVSADGKTVIAKVLPALPSHIKVPQGAKVEVVDKDTGQKYSLSQYVNAHSEGASRDDEGNAVTPKVTVETVQDWPEAVAWLDAMAGLDDKNMSHDTWYDADNGGDKGAIFGFDQDTLLLGGLVGAGIVGGALLLDSGGTKDNIAPVAPSGLDLATADDTGSSTTDNITSLTTGLTITGTAEAGARVELFDGTTSLGTVTATAQGTFTMDLDLAAGVHPITAKATDSAGNVSTSSTALSIAVDTTVPTAVTALDLATADDTGVSPSDNITTKIVGLTITGTADSGARVELFDGTTSLGTATAGSNGAFTLDISLGEGTHNVTAVASDLAGNAAPASAPLTIVVDATPPAPPMSLDLAAEDDNGISNSDNITSKTTNLTISGTATANSEVQLYDGTTSLGTVLTDASGHFAKDINLAIGGHNILATVSDTAGNVSAPSVALEISVVPLDSTLLNATDSTQSFG